MNRRPSIDKLSLDIYTSIGRARAWAELKRRMAATGLMDRFVEAVAICRRGVRRVPNVRADSPRCVSSRSAIAGFRPPRIRACHSKSRGHPDIDRVGC